MPQRPRIRHYRTALLMRGLLLLILSLTGGNLLADSLSDLLIVLDQDGRSYTAQQVLSSEGAQVAITLPTSRITLETRFSGPGRQIDAHASDDMPARLSLRSGSVLTRYRHRYGTWLLQPQPGIYHLDANLEHPAVQTDDPATMQWSVTWILPANATLQDFTDRPAAASPPFAGAAGHWQRSGKLITYRQSGGTLAELHLKFSLDRSYDKGIQPCIANLDPNDECSPDVDGDEVPDYRDICLPPSAGEAALAGAPADAPSEKNTAVAMRGTNGAAGATAGREPDSAAGQHQQDLLGCANETLMVLAGVRFQSGQSYLDTRSRDTLDRVALALLRVPDKLFEVGSHTDNAGRVGHNQRLSENRADSVRHYLMLRGVSPNQVRSRGYGETSPAHDNRLAAGRRANRRTELRRLN